MDVCDCEPRKLAVYSSSAKAKANSSEAEEQGRTPAQGGCARHGERGCYAVCGGVALRHRWRSAAEWQTAVILGVSLFRTEFSAGTSRAALGTTNLRSY